MDYLSSKNQSLLEWLLQLKCAAINSSNLEAFSETWSQLVTIRKVLSTSSRKLSSSKRKSHHLQQQKSTAPCGLPTKKLYKRSIEKLEGNISIGRSVSEVINCADSDKISKQVVQDPCSSISSSEFDSSISRNQGPKKFSQDDELDWRSASGQNNVPIYVDDSASSCKKCRSDRESDESVEVPELGYDLPKQVSRTLTLQDDSECGSSTCHQHISTVAISDASTDGAKTTSPKNEPPRRSNRLTHFLGDRLQEKVIPVGERFQADIPAWTGPPGDEHLLESSKWLGEKIWPIEGGNMNINMKLIGKGRPAFLCSCDYPDSTECINYHIHDKRCRLISDIDDAFFSWGFDKMGEVVSDSWTLEEENSFNNLFKRKSTLSKENFWKCAFKHLPLKSRESIVSYYFNVFVLQNVKTQVRLGYPIVDSDDDEVGEKCKQV